MEELVNGPFDYHSPETELGVHIRRNPAIKRVLVGFATGEG
jgi:hypothetical protein